MARTFQLCSTLQAPRHTGLSNEFHSAALRLNAHLLEAPRRLSTKPIYFPAFSTKSSFGKLDQSMVHLDSSTDIAFRLHVAFILLAVLAVGLRFLARASSRLPYAADDWWILLSLAFFVTDLSLGITISLSNYGSPRTPLPQLERALKIIFIATPMSISVTATSKISILCLYRRLFPVQSFRRNSMAIGILVVVWWITAAVGSILHCIPIQAAYRLSVAGQCINFAAYFLGLELVNCLLDIVMLYLPLGVVRRLQMPMQRKIQISVIFLLGGLVFVAGIVRMAMVYRSHSTKLSPGGNVVWATIENGFSIICGCLPTYGPLLSKGQVNFSNIVSHYSRVLSGIRGSNGFETSKNDSSAQASEDRRHDHYNKIEDGAHDMTHINRVYSRTTDEVFTAGKDYPLEDFRVRKSTDMV